MNTQKSKVEKIIAKTGLGARTVVKAVRLAEKGRFEFFSSGIAKKAVLNKTNPSPDDFWKSKVWLYGPKGKALIFKSEKL